MKIRSISILITIIFYSISPYDFILGQYLTNPSLEGPAGTDGQPYGWQNSPLLTGSDPNFYSSFIPLGSDKEYTPIDGETFTLYRARGRTYNESHHEPETREYSFQELIKPLETNSCFKFEAYLAFNPHHQVMDSDPDLVDKSFPLKLQVWGGNGPYARDKLLVDSDPISNEDWLKYTFYFSTEDIEYSWILFEVQWDTISVRSEPYNAYMLIDNLALESIGVIDTLLEHTLYYSGDGETQLTAANGLSFSWSPNDNLFPPDGQLPFMLSYHDFYSVYIDRGEQCSSVELFNVILDCDTLYGNPLDRSKEYYYKYDTLAQLNASAGETWSWDPPTNLTAYDIQAPRMTGFQEEYIVTITDRYDCIFTDYFNILLHCDTLYPESTILVLDTLVEQESNILLNPRYGTINSLWTPSRFLDCIDCQSAVASPRSTTTYRVELDDEFGCIHVEEFLIEVEFRVPNVITPNGDGYNDCLKIYGLPENTAFRVYDKNGLLIYSVDPYRYDFCWEGIDKNGDPLRAGTYWYALDHPVLGILKKGFILIKR
jgi:gliding motility-associated-like protein